MGKGPESPACPIQSPGSSQPRTCPPGEAEGHLPPESLKPPLSALVAGTQKLPLYQALGKWEEARGIAPGSGVGQRG